MKIVFLDDFYYANEIADVTFYLDINGKPFPDNQWTDFAISVLELWISNILQEYDKEQANFALYFMDGPYYVDCHREGDIVHLFCVEDRESTKVVCESNITFIGLVDELIKKSAEMIQLVNKQQFEYLRDLEKLKSSLKLLKKRRNIIT